MTSKRVTKSAEEKKGTLNSFYNDLYAHKICYALSEEETGDIRGAVIKIVEKIANQIGKIDTRLLISEVVLVGSAKEGTQIILPEEYDFLLILEKLSHQGVIDINNACPGKDNRVHAIIKDNKVKRQFKDLLQGDEIRSTQDDVPFFWRSGLREIFYNAAKAVIRAFVNIEIRKATGTLRLEYPSLTLHGPAFTPRFQWHRRSGKKIDISVDLCPAIRLTGDFPELINLENVTSEVYYRYAQDVGSLLLLPCKRGFSCSNGLCFSVNYTETEMLLMDDLSEHHRKCYKILKYLMNAKQRPALIEWADNIAEPETAFFSYILKVLILNHHYDQVCTETKCLASCIERVLHKTLNILLSAKIAIAGIPHRNWLSSPFFKNHNIWSSHSRKFAHQDLNLRLRILLINLDYIGNMKEYKFENCYVNSVRRINVSLLAMPFTTAALVSLFSVYIYPEFGHSMEDICAFLIWKYIQLGKIIWMLNGPVDCKSENCCIPAAKRKKLAIKNESRLSDIYFIVAVEISIFAVYIYPDCGHLIGDMGKFLARKFIELSKEI